MSATFTLASSVIEIFNAGGVDKTNGGIYFAHGDEAWSTNAQANLEEQAAIDGLSNNLSVMIFEGEDNSFMVVNNIYDPPYGRYPFPNGYCTIYAPTVCQLYLGLGNPMNSHLPQ